VPNLTYSALYNVRARNRLNVIRYSLEECEALCSRLAIMVDGHLCCIGSVQHLKNKFAVGYQLHIKFHSDNNEKAKDYVLKSFVGK